MLITPAGPCCSIAGLLLSRRISRQFSQITELPSRTNSNTRNTISTVPATSRASKPLRCGARRRVRDDGEDEDETYGYNEEIAMLETYSQTCRDEALIVTAIVDGEEVEVLIFKGFSSCLSGDTAVDPARSVLPERAVITKIDRVRGPFDPSQIHYIQKGLSFQAFKETMVK
ncbi:hypothetical protein Bca4012_078325 [Brassica carinata]|uniref:DUF7734 domain-containing protein n=4 Tax=Brassica TaxID=3705 RepID=A0A0D3DA78_BRAOL|nr:PREDICTED: uncharacterized protein LOC106304120 [Brassica oleracea var. oleracea]XP_013705112.2 uncharacterized protein BNAC07G21120D [Brassica napus]KAF3595715.1 hypothetical protein DY000_02024971 [Brassica cretica]KAG2264512.1 hypothetical protein Bca52824_071591 [Brassica carinata]VDD38216.1 unnamed protein product [Brassica oleracea]